MISPSAPRAKRRSSERMTLLAMLARLPIGRRMCANGPVARSPQVEADYIRRVADNLRALRTAAGLTQKQVAERAELDRRLWIRLEAGQVNMTLHTIARVAVALDVDPAQLAAPRARVS